MTLGTGKGVEHGLACSIKTLNPDSVIFLGSSESPDLLERLKPLVPEFVPRFQPLRFMADKNDMEKCALDSRKLILELLENGVSSEDVEADFTSGTKAMTAGLCIAAVALGVGRLVYVTGDRDPQTGRVITGTERVLSIYPMRLIIQNKRQQLRTLFNKRLFADGLNIIEEVLSSCKLPEIQEEFAFWNILFKTYWLWDSFNHVEANETIGRIPKQWLERLGLHLSGNKEILGRVSKKLKQYKEQSQDAEATVKLLSSKEAELLLVDILANAERRGSQGKYDDAVARLYRACELIAQIALARYGIDTSKLKSEQIPEGLMPLFPEISQGEKVATMGLDRSYKFLKAKDEEKANNYLENKKLQGLLSKRNSSILAHGLLPVEKKTYTDLREQVLKLASNFYPGIDEFLAKASFPKIEVTL
ncbi:MAG: TIGR02710 family CRISPR-associated protein [Deltaproteobacteria bacterium]|nr:MAG: TIGR02710 family CRISPR-associated protein [Deltaproteobacteria bacterium]